MDRTCGRVAAEGGYQPWWGGPRPGSAAPRSPGVGTQVGRSLEHKPGAKREQAQPGEQRRLGGADTKGHARGERVRQRYHEAPQEGDRPKPGSARRGAESVLQPGVAPRAGARAIKEECGQLG
eukprot:scaffold11710_cov127-Isochrysis_galbana.AAC.4